MAASGRLHVFASSDCQSSCCLLSKEFTTSVDLVHRQRPGTNSSCKENPTNAPQHYISYVCAIVHVDLVTLLLFFFIVSKQEIENGSRHCGRTELTITTLDLSVLTL
jgi:hypothetical protein